MQVRYDFVRMSNDMCHAHTVSSCCDVVLFAVPGFSGAVRQYVLHVLGMTYSKVQKQVLGQALQLEGAALGTLVSDMT